MKIHPHRRSFRHLTALVLAGSIAALLSSPSGFAAVITWANTGTDFNAGASWVNGTAPGPGDTATFTGAAVTQPDLSANLTILGLSFGSASSSGYTFTSANGSTLIYTGAFASFSTSGTNTISAALISTVGPTTNRTLTQFAGGTLNLSGGFSATTATTARLNLIGGGAINLAGTNTFNSPGTVTSAGIQLGNSSSTVETLGITGGTTSMAVGTLGLSIGLGSSPATVNVTGGTLNLQGPSSGSGAPIFVGGTSSAGILNVSGGAVNIDANASFAVGHTSGTGTLNVNAGTITVSKGTIGTTTNTVETRYILLGLNGGNSTVNLGNGPGSTGVLATDRIFASDGSSTAGSATTAAFVFNGGTLKALGANSDWLQAGASSTSNPNANALTSVTTTAASTIDSNSFAVGVKSAISGVGGFTIKDSSGSGTGVVTFRGANGYTGNTTVHAGTLKLDAGGSIDSSAKIIVGDAGSTGTHLDVTTKTGGLTIGTGQTLQGIGTVDGATAVGAGGIIAPGNSIGTLTIGDLSLTSANSHVALEIDLGLTPAADLLKVTGGILLANSTLDLSIAHPASLTGSETFLFAANDLSDPVTGIFGTITGVPDGETAVVNYAYTGTDALGRIGDGNDIAITFSEISAVPEPGTALFGLACLSALGLRRRRRSA